MVMKNCWKVLGIEPTDDKNKLRKRYSELVKQHHPEEDPNGYQEIRKAYETALRLLKEGKSFEEVEKSPSMIEPSLEAQPSSTTEKQPSLFDEIEQQHEEEKNTAVLLADQLYNSEERNQLQKWKQLFEEQAAYGAELIEYLLDTGLLDIDNENILNFLKEQIGKTEYQGTNDNRWATTIKIRMKELRSAIPLPLRLAHYASAIVTILLWLPALAAYLFCLYHAWYFETPQMLMMPIAVMATYSVLWHSKISIRILNLNEEGFFEKQATLLLLQILIDLSSIFLILIGYTYWQTGTIPFMAFVLYTSSTGIFTLLNLNRSWRMKNGLLMTHMSEGGYDFYTGLCALIYIGCSLLFGWRVITRHGLGDFLLLGHAILAIASLMHTDSVDEVHKNRNYSSDYEENLRFRSVTIFCTFLLNGIYLYAGLKDATVLSFPQPVLIWFIGSTIIMALYIIVCRRFLHKNKEFRNPEPETEEEIIIVDD